MAANLTQCGALKLITLITLITFIQGCTATTQLRADGSYFVAYNNHEIISEKEINTLTRNDKVARVSADMEKVGFEDIAVSRILNKVTFSINGVFKHQYELIKRYKVIVDQHRDVTSFLKANSDKTAAEIQAEISRFDSMVTEQDQKIGPRIKQYKQASEQIQKENSRLTKLLLSQTVELAEILQENRDQILGIEGVMMLINATKIDDAFKLAEIRIHLATIANDLIKDEKAVLEVTKEIQSLLNNQL